VAGHARCARDGFEMIAAGNTTPGDTTQAVTSSEKVGSSGCAERRRHVFPPGDPTEVGHGRAHPDQKSWESRDLVRRPLEGSVDDPEGLGCSVQKAASGTGSVDLDDSDTCDVVTPPRTRCVDPEDLLGVCLLTRHSAGRGQPGGKCGEQSREDKTALSSDPAPAALGERRNVWQGRSETSDGDSTA
jgi:hypothetical protein